MLATSVKMIGELDFDNLFFDNPGDNPDMNMTPYPIFSMLFFLGFIIVMPILIMNLLVRIFRLKFFRSLIQNIACIKKF